MPRHRGTYNPENKEAYELSRSRIENFVKCPACFYLTQVKGIKFPSIPGFNINEATDVLLKRDFDKFRGAETTHDFLINLDMGHLIPFEHPKRDHRQRLRENAFATSASGCWYCVEFEPK